MIESQYIDSYLTMTADPGTRYTPDTYLSYTLGGRAKNWSSGYARALMRAVNRRVAAGTVVPVPSVGGSTAWMRADDLTADARSQITAVLAARVARREALLAARIRRARRDWQAGQLATRQQRARYRYEFRDLRYDVQAARRRLAEWQAA